MMMTGKSLPRPRAAGRHALRLAVLATDVASPALWTRPSGGAVDEDGYCHIGESDPWAVGSSFSDVGLFYDGLALASAAVSAGAGTVAYAGGTLVPRTGDWSSPLQNNEERDLGPSHGEAK
ncbi:hypothetical protein [Olsenella sp. Marseille-P4559]|uniref:hypothetical protein n=1 Tax=Olsenella sp. Marseille-P4559 TaxID=2364795 RepID=UPI001031E2AA|nr:hypothetical protein [Olsenella sp. Marseille-P4559]